MQTTIDLSKLNDKEIMALRKQLLNANRMDKSELEKRNTVIDGMLQVKENGEFKWTTRDILNELIKSKVVKADISKADQGEWLKKIQTRKQLLEKQTNEDGSLKHKPGTFGYKFSGVFGNILTSDRIVDWMLDDDNVKKLSPADKAAILKALK